MSLESARILIIQNNELHHAAADPSGFDSVRYIIEELGVDANQAHTQHGTTAIEFAAQSGHFDTFKYLFETAHAHIDAREKPCNLLNWALDNSDEKVKQYIVDPQNNLIEQFNDGTTRLHVAAQLGDFQSIKQWVAEHPESIQQQDIRGQGAIFFAATHGHFSICHYLMMMAEQFALPIPNLFTDLNRGTARYHLKRAQSCFDAHLQKEEYQHCLDAKQCLEMLPEHTADDYMLLSTVYKSLSHIECDKKQYESANDLLSQALVWAHLSPHNTSMIEAIQNQIKLIQQAQRMQQQGFEIINMPSDGNCFFHAMVHALQGTKYAHLSVEQVRKAALEHMWVNWSQYQSSSSESRETYIARQNNPTSWADDLLILATARRFHLTLVVISELEQSTQASYTQIYKRQEAIKVVYLLNENNHHIKRLLPQQHLSSVPYQTRIDATEFDQFEHHTMPPQRPVPSKSTEESPIAHGSAFRYVKQRSKQTQGMSALTTQSSSTSLLPMLTTHSLLTARKEMVKTIPHEEQTIQGKTPL